MTLHLESPTTKPTPSVAEQRSYWDERWSEQRLPNDYQRRRGDAVLAILKSLQLENPQILDFGCGTGWFTDQLSAVGRPTGIDLSDVAIAQARASYPDTRFIAGNLYETTLATELFDVVVSQEVLPHVQDPAAYLDIIARILKPDGYLIITAANRLVIERWDRGGPDPDAHLKFYPSRREFTRMVRSRFRVLRTTSIMPIGDQGMLRVVNSYKLNQLAAWLITRKAVERLKGWAGLGYTLIAVARKRS